MSTPLRKGFKKISSLKDKKVRKNLSVKLRAKAHSTLRAIRDGTSRPLVIGDKIISKDSPIFIIAEIGVNHDGKVEIAKRLISEAKKAGADAVKFQKRHLTATYQKKLLDNPEQFDQAFHYLIPLLKEFEFNEEEYVAIKAHADNVGILIFATPFDEPSVDFIESIINPPLYKVASADLTNLPLLEKLLATKKPLILSTGMSTIEEIVETVGFLDKNKANYALLHCQSTYPAGNDTINLSFMKSLKDDFGAIVGYSGHERGIEPTLAAVGLGAKIVERHITHDKTALGPDHTASLNPDEFAEMVTKIRSIEEALGTSTRRISRGEAMSRLTLRKSLVANREIEKNEIFTREMIASKSPGNGISPFRLYDLIGRKAARLISKDELFTEEDLGFIKRIFENSAPPSNWGLKARFIEIPTLSLFKPEPKFLEFHLNDKDLEFSFPASAKYPFDFIVHAPEYQGKTHIDLASNDDALWENSIRVMQATINKTRDASKHFNLRSKPKIVIHVGGMSLSTNVNPEKLFDRAITAFKRLDATDVELLPENLPAFGWFFSGLWYINFFGNKEEIVRFCEELNLKMCLDLSHAWLYTQHAKVDYIDYIKTLAPYTAHLHIADGRGTQKEGLQIGEGDVPFDEVFELLEKYLPDRGKETSWVPEIWQGHMNDYHEFKIALEKLANYPLIGKK